jgi:Papain family cysteine protease
VPILDQGAEGACTGFGLATVINYLLCLHGKGSFRSVSPRMLYDMAKRYDEWPGETYEGSSARGAMKGWHKHGVCAETSWPQNSQTDSHLTVDRSADARRRPLGAYYRVNHRDLICMHSALTEVGILYASSEVHQGWDEVGADGQIPLRDKIIGGHAFAIVGYNERGFWIQNSWGRDWGKVGFGLIGYDDWLTHGSDIWVARLGVPVESQTWRGTAALAWSPAGHPLGYTHDDLRPHIIGIGNNGLLRATGNFGSTPESVAEIFNTYIPDITAGWKKKRILLFAHGGLVGEDSAIQRLAENRESLLKAQVYPISFIWKSDYWTTLTNILRDALSRRTVGGILDGAKDFMLDRLDDGLEPFARAFTGKTEWDKMKENALAATASPAGGARLALQHLAALVAQDSTAEIHVVGHSAGAIFHAALIQLLTATGPIKTGPLTGGQGLGLKVKTCTLWAPACTVELFKQTYRPAILSKAIEDFAVFGLKDQIEQDDNCANIYHKSLLYLVSNAFEDRVHIPLLQPDGEPILGMAKFLKKDKAVAALFKNRNAEWIPSPNDEPLGSRSASTARHHGGFDDDTATLRATFARIAGTKTDSAAPRINPHEQSEKSLQGRLGRLASASSLSLEL